MEAAIMRSHGAPTHIGFESTYPDPRPTDDEVLIRVRATSLNYHDVFTCRGMPGIRIPMPCIPGLDFAGEIVETGSQVTGWQPGDRVLVDPMDRSPRRGGLVGEVRPGGLAQYCAVPAHHLLRLPDTVDYETAACLPVAYGTAHRLMMTIGQIGRGDRVLIMGASGGVGTCCVQLAKLAGAEVIACASNEEKIAKLKTLGADHVINYSTQDIVQWVYEHFGKPHRREYARGVDVVVNFTGGNTWVDSLKILRRQGKLLTCGATAGYDPKEDIRYIWTFELKILGSNGWERSDLASLFDLVTTRKLRPTIHKKLALNQAAEGFRMLEQREAFGKILILP